VENISATQQLPITGKLGIVCLKSFACRLRTFTFDHTTASDNAWADLICHGQFVVKQMPWDDNRRVGMAATGPISQEYLADF